MPTTNLALEGKHNIKNAMAAATVAHLLKIRKDTIRESLECFQGAEHRLGNQSPLAAPTASRPVFVQNIDNTTGDWGIKVYPTTITSGISCSYVRKPNEVQWTYTEVDGVPLYNANNAIDFELHESDETSLVIKILSYSGVIVRQLEVTEVAEAKENKTVTQEKS